MSGVCVGVEQISAHSYDEPPPSVSLVVNISETPLLKKRVVVYDCRLGKRVTPGAETERVLDISGLKDFNDFLQVVSKEFAIRPNETFVLTTTDRIGIDFDRYEELQDGNTLHLLQSEDQILSVATQERIVFLPHYDTLVQSGMYEYYASEGQKSLPYAFAELIDNALSATSRNTGARTIDIRLLFDESQGRPAVVIIDNGCGMTSKQLNNWAVYRLSKFTRENSTFTSDNAGYIRPDPVPRSLNSDISYFGVGGKQAVFYIGQSTRMITRPAGSPDVHELVLSKEEFERKERNKEDIYSGFIRNRKVGDTSHIRDEEERFLHGLISEEFGKESFTAVVITGVQPEHITFLKQDFLQWTRELAHLYHYYIHGIDGNDMKATHKNPSNDSKIDFQISLREKFPKIPRMVNLREIDNDMQTLYINSSADTFEFKAYATKEGTVDGLLRYHPFLYDRETYPEDPSAVPACLDEDDEDGVIIKNEARGKRPVFECFWNGRLIPYTTVSEFDWCACPKKAAKLPADCYKRISGVLFTNDRFQVSTNKLTFMDLELQLKNKDTFFTRVVKGQEQRVKIDKEFTQWLKTCHEKWDKQVKFVGFKGIIKRTDVPTKKMQSPWATFSSIKWDGRTYKTGQYVKSQKTHPIFFGSILKFLLYGDHEGDVYSTGGQVQVAMEPKALYDEVRTIPISKIDRTVTNASIKKSIEEELAKLPEKLNVMWPEVNAWPPNAVRSAGTYLGPLKVEILNKKGESISKMPTATHKLLVELKVVRHGTNGDVETNSHIAQYSAKWGFWFKTMENLSLLGKYTLYLNTVLNESNATVWGGKQLPSHTLQFSIVEGSAERFVVGALTTPLHVGVPFDLVLELVDEYGHLAQPPPKLKPVLECSDLDLSYEGADVSGTTFTIRGVRARGNMQSYQCKIYDVKVVLPGLKQDTQTVKISLLPGNPHTLKVKPEDHPVTVENGSCITFDVEVHDEAGNVTAHPRLIVSCQLQGTPGSLTTVEVDCSNTGVGRLVVKRINLKNMKGEHSIKAKFDIPSQKSVAGVQRELRVVPSRRVSRLEVYSQEEEGGEDAMLLKDKEKIDWTAGDVLDNLHYRMYDEGGREVPLTAEHAGMIKVNWTAEVSVEDLSQGRLPSVVVPTLVKEEHFYQLSYQDQAVSVETSFTILPRPDEPKQIKATLTDTSVRMGEVLSGKIYLELMDQYGNKTQALSSTSVDAVAVAAEDLDKSALVLTWQESTQSMEVTGVRFRPGTPGTRELSFTWKDFVEYVRVKVTPGLPTQIQLVDGPEQPLQVLNEQGIQKAFLLQVYDPWGNVSLDQGVVVVLRTSSKALKITSSVMSKPVDAEGKASFVVDNVSGPKGEYELEFRGTFNKKAIPGPSVKLTIIPDPSRPVKLTVEYDRQAMFPAGSILTEFLVSVMSEEGGPIQNLNPAALSMLMWKGEASGTRPPAGASQFKCSKPMDNEKKDCFHFREKVIPERVGKYTLQFVLCIDKIKGLWSHQYVINVVPNDPVMLAPDSQQPTPVVSNSNVIANRTLVWNMTLKLMDAYDNPAGLDLSGKVVVSIKSSSGSSNKDLPLFNAKAKTLRLPLSEGQADVSNLTIMENSPGLDGHEYFLVFKPSVSGFGPKKPLAAYELPFHFYNDVENQKQMSEKTRQKDQLSQTIDIYKSLFDTNKQLIAELNNQVQDAATKEKNMKSQLRKSSVKVDQLASITEIDALISEKTADAERFKVQPRRVCSLADPFTFSVDVLGKIGHLALVEDDDVARVLSWHLLGDMDCVVTTTTTAARRIYDDTQGKQQVMPLDTVFWKSFNRPLPHIKNGQSSFRPVGNPVFARDLLIYPQNTENTENCQMVFGNLLGDTIVVDDLDSANHYRKGVVQGTAPCPTLLTRQGDRIRANGKFGGLQNKAPPIEKLRDQVFGAPLPKQFHNLQGEIELLQQYQLAMQKSLQVKDDFDSHMEYLKCPEMVKKEAEMEDQEQQLKQIEKSLASTPVRSPFTPPGGKHSLQDAGEPSGITPKRARRKLNQDKEFV